MTRELIAVETGRVSSRLESLPLTKMNDDVITHVRAAALRIVAMTPDPERPEDVDLPPAGPTALAAQLSVVVRDYLNMRTAASQDAAVAEVLSDLRRSLP